jgi:hypothetical protein
LSIGSAAAYTFDHDRQRVLTKNLVPCSLYSLLLAAKVLEREVF